MYFIISIDRVQQCEPYIHIYILLHSVNSYSYGKVLNYLRGDIILHQATARNMKEQAFNFLATPHQSAISSFRSSLSFFSPEAQIDGGKKHEGNETWTAVHFSRSGFVKRFASLAAAFSPMTLRLHVSTGFHRFYRIWFVFSGTETSYIDSRLPTGLSFKISRLDFINLKIYIWKLSHLEST